MTEFTLFILVNSKDFMGMMNIDIIQHLTRQKRVLKYILDFNKDIYGLDVKVSIVEKIREEKKFFS